MIPFHKTANHVVLAAAAIMSLAGLVACSPDDNLTDPTQPNPPDFAPIAAANNASLVVLTTGGQLLVSNATGPGAEVRPPVTIATLGTNETIRAIDFRVSSNGLNTGVLYGVGVTAAALQVAPFTARLYTIDRFTGVATLVPGGNTFTVNSVNLGFDFDPASANTVRVVSEAEDNLSVDADTGIGTAQTALTPVGSVAGAAYTNTFPGTAASTLYVVDHSSNSILRQGDVDGTPSAPSLGALTLVGSLGVNPGADVGFDIDGFAGVGYLGFGVSVYTVNLGTGAATFVGTVSDGTLAVRDIAVTTPTSALGFAVRNTGATAELVTFAINAASTPTVIGANIVINSDLKATTAPVALAVGETIVGLDFRPNPVLGSSALPTGQLFALSKNGAAICLYSMSPTATTYRNEDAADPDTDPDEDGDGVDTLDANGDELDNCPLTPNPLQEDTLPAPAPDNDGIGDACDATNVIATPFDLYPDTFIPGTNPPVRQDPASAGVQCRIDTATHSDDDEDPSTSITNDDGTAGPDTPTSLGPTLLGTAFGFDFNPTVDRIRVVTDMGENLRLNPTNGTAVDSSTTTAGVQTDSALSGTDTMPAAAAYTNNFPLQFRTGATPTATSLFLIDVTTNNLARQGALGGGTTACPDSSNPNCGVTATIGATGVDFGGDTAFDIIGGNTLGPAGTNYVNAVGYAVSGNNLYRVNLLTGAATLVGSISGNPITAATVRLRR